MDADRTVVAAAPSGGLSSAAVAVDVALLTVREERLLVLLQRPDAPGTEDLWSLPGGRVHDDENLDEAARRFLADVGGVTRTEHLEQLRTYGEPGRDPRARVVAVGYLAFTPGADAPTTAPGPETRYVPVDEVMDGTVGLAFDHDRIVADALARARAKLEYRPLATAFVEHPFTIADLRGVYEAVWGVALDPANFRRKVASTPGFVVATDRKAPPGRGGGRPATLYQPGPATRLHPAMLQPGRET